MTILRIGESELPYIPAPRMSSNKRYNQNWICTSVEYCTWDGFLGFSCSGHGNTIEEAYSDWLETYTHDRYLKDD